MKVIKEDLREVIESFIGNGVMSGEEIDVTARNIMNAIWPVIDRFQQDAEPMRIAIKDLEIVPDEPYHSDVITWFNNNLWEFGELDGDDIVTVQVKAKSLTTN
jgi:hypothetical protein